MKTAKCSVYFLLKKRRRNVIPCSAMQCAWQNHLSSVIGFYCTLAPRCGSKLKYRYGDVHTVTSQCSVRVINVYERHLKHFMELFKACLKTTNYAKCISFLQCIFRVLLLLHSVLWQRNPALPSKALGARQVTYVGEVPVM